MVVLLKYHAVEIKKTRLLSKQKLHDFLHTAKAHYFSA